MEDSVPRFKRVAPKRYREVYGLYYEDFTIGDVIEHRPGRTITETDNIWFSLLTLAIVAGMTVHSTSQKAIANLGFDKVRLTKPVFVGETLYAHSEIMAKRESRSRPTQGLITVATT